MPRKWYSIYRKITPDDDPLRRKYDELEPAPPLEELPKSEFEFVKQQMMKPVAVWDMTGANSHDLSEDERDYIVQQIYLNDAAVVANVDEHRADYEQDDDYDMAELNDLEEMVEAIEEGRYEDWKRDREQGED